MQYMYTHFVLHVHVHVHVYIIYLHVSPVVRITKYQITCICISLKRIPDLIILSESKPDSDQLQQLKQLSIVLQVHVHV